MKVLAISFLLLLTGLNSDSVLAGDNAPAFRHAYHQTLVMKLFLAIPDGKGGSLVGQDFQGALEIIKETDQLTLGVPKIIYLVGWQYNGHDDKYPAFFDVNPALKRKTDATALESLKWLMKEAEQYHTTVSLHINMTDAYEDSPLWATYKNEGMLSRNADGSLLVIGNYNNRKAYQINYQREWEKGYAQKRVDQLLEMLPELKKAGTVHLDAWIARESKGHRETMIHEAYYQQQLADYWHSKGIDPTSEWVMDYMLGKIPYYWHFNGRTQEDYLKQPASLCTGSRMNPDLKNSDFGLEFLFGTSMYGENIFPDRRKQTDQSDWQTRFQKEFFLNYLQYDFLNRHQRLSVEGEASKRVARFSGNIQVSLADSTVKQEALVYREKQTVFFPIGWRKDNSFAIYSTSDKNFTGNIPDSWKNARSVQSWELTKNGLVLAGVHKFRNNQVSIHLKANQPLLLVPDQLANEAVSDTTYFNYGLVKKKFPHPAYHQTLTLKLFMSQALFDGKFKRRDNGKTEVYLNAVQALEQIKKIDALTLGMPKIVYLVGWQYNGHDSKYPAWFEANLALKRKEDSTAIQSIRWLMKEARAYNTSVSLHINMFDAYEDSPLWDAYVKNNIIARKKDGSLLGGEWGYPISYAQEWATGYAQKRIDSLCDLLPIREAGTIHIDAFHTWPPIPYIKPDGSWGVDLDRKPTSPYLSFTVQDEQEAQQKIYAYWASKGIDVTSEGVDFLRSDAFAEEQSMAWWFNNRSYYLKWPASTYTGGRDNSEWGRLFGTSMHGEEILKNDPIGLRGFKEQFSTGTAIWYFLNQLNRKFLVESSQKKEVHYAENVVSSLHNNGFRLTQAGVLLAEDKNVLIPAGWINSSSLLAYSADGYEHRTWKLPPGYERFRKLVLYEVSAAGTRKIKETTVQKGSISLSLVKDQLLLIKMY
ncbi:endo-alpha-N-acetylgalactosaminidase family protein [Flavihumibacter sp. CACIAM 22H1]|uniref:endo-alpha-N-acetylgalactosaminidase family protein n=1 Tax=Flavihumibacter sp. CACIAM 22H1 TaxID=1812911 RepID=UPI0007A87036|nr:endo-alpha-N-acetylgalactosaminidase family protein [Flavihumibacter sp. CACIAM 22H1]KYP15267.1 MAG: hypothetical protein A1D16_15280 [Flavihumibacter sp. CACIAM 22H1]